MLYRCVRPLLFSLDAERAHRLTFASAAVLAHLPGGLAAVSAISRFDHPALAVDVFGLRFPNPVGLAAGFDKDATLVPPLAAVGFGFLELGSVTPRPQPGNPRPRLFRLREDQGIINRMGFNNRGAVALAERLASLHARPIPLGVNLGKNKDTPLDRAAEDYVQALRAVGAVADYAVVNVSSPNTPGLRNLQQAAELQAILSATLREREQLARATGRVLPILVKFAPDLDPNDLETAVQASLDAGISGIIATNTTLQRDGLRSALGVEAGGLSGRPLFPLAVEAVRRIAGLTAGRIPVIGVGGIASAEDAYAFIRAGATLVQLYTGLVYQGPGVVRQIKRGLVRLLKQDGFERVSEAVGTSR
jgi:dihydroorotate dehydrogenase